MKIIVPMSGFGERFHCAGYKVPNPLIEIDGKPIVENIVDVFPDHSDFIFICEDIAKWNITNVIIFGEVSENLTTLNCEMENVSLRFFLQ
jgi:choline kinase